LNVGNDLSTSRPSHVIVRDFINGERRDKRNAMFHSQSQTLSKVVIERHTDAEHGNHEPVSRYAMRKSTRKGSSLTPDTDPWPGARERRDCETDKLEALLVPTLRSTQSVTCTAPFSLRLYSQKARAIPKRTLLYAKGRVKDQISKGNWSYAAYQR
jgi:hypothetical protein